MAQVRLRIELSNANTFLVVDVDLEATHVSSLQTLANFIDQQMVHLDQTYRVDETTLMVERVDGIFANENVIKNLDRAWLGHERAIVYGGADHVTDSGDQAGTQGKALKSIEETTSSGSQVADAAKGKGRLRPSDKDSKKDTLRSPAPHDERRTAKGERTAEVNGEGDKRGPNLAPARRENVIQETPRARGIGDWHMLPGADSRRGSALQAPATPARIVSSADTFIASGINANEPMTPTSESQTAGSNIPDDRVSNTTKSVRWQRKPIERYDECERRENIQRLGNLKHQLRVEPVPDSIYEGESASHIQPFEGVRNYEESSPCQTEPNAWCETAVEGHKRDGSQLRPQEPTALSKTAVEVHEDQGWGGGGVSPLSQEHDSYDKSSPSRGQGENRGRLEDRALGGLVGQ
ncbi:hypothetical protein N7G274_003309 [Stereocaulon virgatum]|uniref:Coilin n=1 Tax=Stereocaulon virgatum TaxID=373712 RepID=A0ABR4ADG5_9LECA